MGKKKKSSKKSETLSTNDAKNMKDVEKNQIEDNESSVPIKEEPKHKDIHETNNEVNKPDSNLYKDSLNKQNFDVKNEAQNKNIEQSMPEITQKVNEIDHPKCSKSRRSRRRLNKYLNQQEKNNLEANNEGSCDIMDTRIITAIQKINNEEVTTSCSSNKDMESMKNNPINEQMKDQKCNKMKSEKGNEGSKSSKKTEEVCSNEITNPKRSKISFHLSNEKHYNKNSCSSSNRINNEEDTTSCSSNKDTKSMKNNPINEQMKDQKYNKMKSGKGNEGSKSSKKGYDKTQMKSERKNDNSTQKNLNSYKYQICTGNKDFPKDKILTENTKSFIEEIDENLFDLDNEFALGHCVAEDLKMGAGIAVDFKHKFGGVGNLIDQNLRVGDVGVLQRRGRYIFYLITKHRSNGKPTMHTMKKALLTLLNCMTKLRLTKLGIPLIGCGLDGLDWSEVKKSIIDIFNNSGIQITVCIPSKLDHKTPFSPIKVYNTPKNLWEIDPQTYIIIFIDLNQVQKSNWKNEVIDNVNTRYPFKNILLRDIASKTLKPGDITHYIFNQDIILCGFFHPDMYYSSLEIIFKNVIHLDSYYKYLAIQSGPISSDDNFQHITWIVLILRSFAVKCELWLCGQEVPIEADFDQYCRNKRSSMNFISPNQKDYRYSS